MLVSPAIPFSFSYPDFNGTSGLFVRATIYDVTSGVALSPVTANMTEIVATGCYVGTFTPVAGKDYQIIALVYTDGTYGVIDTTFAPVALNIECAPTDTSELNFNYACFDQDAARTLTAAIYDTTTGSPVFVVNTSMAHVLGGVYYGSYQGAVGHTYEVRKTTDDARAQGVDTFACFSLQAYQPAGPTPPNPGILTALMANGAIDSVLAIRDQIGAVIEPVYFVTRSWYNDAGFTTPAALTQDGYARDTELQMLPSPRLKRYYSDIALPSGGAIQKGDILLRGISRYMYSAAQLAGISTGANDERLFRVGDKIYQVIMISEKYVTWDVRLRELTNQKRYT